MRRTRRPPFSPTYMNRLALSIQRVTGLFSVADVAAPPFPVELALPVPAKVLMNQPVIGSGGEGVVEGRQLGRRLLERSVGTTVGTQLGQRVERLVGALDEEDTVGEFDGIPVGMRLG